MPGLTGANTMKELLKVGIDIGGAILILMIIGALIDLTAH